MADGDASDKRIIKLDDLLASRHPPLPAELTEQVKQLRAEVLRLQVRQDMLAARQQQTIGMQAATRRLVKDVWDWIGELRAFFKGSVGRVDRAAFVVPGGRDMIERFTTQHVEMLYAAEQMANTLSVEALSKTSAADRTHHELQHLVAKVDDHFRVEDVAFNDIIAGGEDDELREHVERHMGEVGGLRQLFQEFSARWGTVEAVAADVNRFAHDAMVLLDMMTYRISQEDTVLFPMIQKPVKEGKPLPREF
jgi:hemerythrin-like domain-containing protein